MTRYQKFQRDDAVAQVTEREVAKVLEGRGVKITEFNKDYRYDLKGTKNNKSITFEVKEDKKVWINSFVAVEFANGIPVVPSGIGTTEADYYIYKMHLHLGYETRLMKTEDLKRICDEKRYVRIDPDSGDEGSYTQIYLFWIKDIRDISVKIQRVP